jgi:hypothetical protein
LNQIDDLFLARGIFYRYDICISLFDKIFGIKQYRKSESDSNTERKYDGLSPFSQISRTITYDTPRMECPWKRTSIDIRISMCWDDRLTPSIECSIRKSDGREKIDGRSWQCSLWSRRKSSTLC